MKPRAALDKLTGLLELPRFTSSDARKRGVSPSTLAHYVKTGELARTARGIYRGKSAPTVDDFRWEDLLEAVQKTTDGVVCLVSALSLYGLTEEISRQHWVAVGHGTRHRGGGLTKVVRMRDITLGKTSIKQGRVSIPIFDRERTIVDSFRYLSREVAIKALKAALSQPKAKRVDVEKLRKYAKALRVKIEPYLLAMTT